MATYDVFLRNNVALRRRRNFGQKRLKMPEKAHKQPILLGIAEHSECVSASNGAIAYSCNKIGRACQPDLCSSLLHFLQIPRKLRYSARLAYLIAPSLKSPHRAFLWLTRGCLRQKRRRLEWSLAALISSLNCDYHLATAPISVFIIVGVFAFTTTIL